jgi:hypothetical protein
MEGKAGRVGVGGVRNSCVRLPRGSHGLLTWPRVAAVPTQPLWVGPVWTPIVLRNMLTRFRRCQ